MKKTAYLLSMLLMWAVAGGVQADAKADAEQAIAAAKAADKKAKGLQGGWVSTGALIKKAEKALEAGDQAMATKLAKKAAHEADLAIKQAEHERDNWAEPPYLK